MNQKQDKIIVFQEKEIRRIWYQEEWWFSVIDIVGVLSESQNPRRYWSDLKRKLQAEGFNEVYEKIVQLKMESPDKKMRRTDAANTEGIFRIIQSIPSPKAEPFKQWLAKVGYERVQEIENPELAAQRARALYKEKGYPDDWIEARLKSIEIRSQLTDEWKERGVQEGIEYAILTSEISKATFGMTPGEYKEHKHLQRENLRDHMTNLELIFTMLGEEGTRTTAIDQDAQGFDQNKEAAKEGGTAAGKARQAYEQETGKRIVTNENFKQQIEAAKEKRKLENKE